MKIIVGDEFGLLKCIDADKKLMHSKFGEIKKKNATIGIANLFDNNNNILAITHEQDSYILNWEDKDIKSKPDIELKNNCTFTSQVIKRTIDFSSVILARSDNIINLIQYDDELKIISNTEHNIKTQKLQMIKDSQATREFFCLFKDTPISIFDLDKNEISWKAKNLPNDEFNLKIPVWDVDVANSKSNLNLFYTATAFGEIRTYDRKVKPSPVNDNKVLNGKINRMVLSNCENYLTVGDTIGNIYMLDKRKSNFI
jgi:hypothetical protein